MKLDKFAFKACASACSVLLLAACGSTGEAAPTATTTVTIIPTSPPSESPQPEENDMIDSPGEVAGDPTQAPTLSAGIPLRLSHFFLPDTFIWEENRYNVADREDAQGIAAVVEYCQRPDKQLELRLENKFKNVEFEVGQANTSAGSSQTLIADVATNGSQADVRRIAFNEIQSFSIPAEGVNALTIDFYLDSEEPNCGEESAIGVLINAELR
jgi:hypothetical protein